MAVLIEERPANPASEWPHLAWWRTAPAELRAAVFVADAAGACHRFDPADADRGRLVAARALWAAGVTMVFAPPAASDRRGRARRRRLLGAVWCDRAVPCLVGAPTPGANHLVVEWPGADDRFVDLVAAVSREWDLVPVVLGTAGPGTARALGRDVAESSGAVALARAVGRRLGRAPEWDVQLDRDPVAAVVGHVRRHRPGLVTVPHVPHGPGRPCQALALAARLDTPVLLA
jgi:hypothetical protein